MSITNHIKKTEGNIKKLENYIKFLEDTDSVFDKNGYEKLPYKKAKKRLQALNSRLLLYKKIYIKSTNKR